MTEMHDLVAPYALDALDSAESRRFERHLEDCAACRAELVAIAESAADLAESVAVKPPPRVKESILEAIDDGTMSTVTTFRSKGNFGWLVAGAAAAIAVVFFGLWATANSRLEQATEIAAVYEAADTTIVDVETANGPARFAYSPSLERVVFNGAALADLPAAEVYQLWLIDSAGPASAGTLVPGDPEVLIRDAAPGLTLAMTIEAAPAATAPSTNPLFANEL